MFSNITEFLPNLTSLFSIVFQFRRLVELLQVVKDILLIHYSLSIFKFVYLSLVIIYNYICIFILCHYIMIYSLLFYYYFNMILKIVLLLSIMSSSLLC